MRSGMLHKKANKYRLTVGRSGISVKPEREIDPKTTWKKPGLRIQVENGQVTQLPNRNFDDLLHDGLGGNFPGKYENTRPSNDLSKAKLSSSFNEKARDGFRYWLIERPKPTSYGKYGIGSFKTVLGVGNAPRT